MNKLHTSSKRITLLTFLCITLSFISVQAQTTFTVTNTDDSGPGSLRQAIIDANASTSDDIIDATGISGSIALESDLPKITRTVTINGPGRTMLSISGEDLYRPFFIDAGTVVIRNLSIINGYARGGDGKTNALGFGGGGGAGMGGGLIANINTQITLTNILFDGNKAVGGNGGGGDGVSNCGLSCLTGAPAANGGAGPFSSASGFFGSGGRSGRFNFDSPYSIMVGQNGGFGGGGGQEGVLLSSSHPFMFTSGGLGGKYGGKAGLRCNDEEEAAGFCTMAGDDKVVNTRIAAGGGAGLGGAIFSRTSAMEMENVQFFNNSVEYGLPDGILQLIDAYGLTAAHWLAQAPSGTSLRGQAKAGALFIMDDGASEPVFENVFFADNTAPDALGTANDNEDILLEGSLTLTDNGAFSLIPITPLNNARNYVDGDPIYVEFNRPIFNGGQPVEEADLPSLISFSSSVAGTPVAFTATLHNGNGITITPTESLTENLDYRISFSLQDPDVNPLLLSESLIFQIDTNPPIFSTPQTSAFLPGAFIELLSDELLYNVDGSVVEDEDLASLISVRLNDTNGDDVPFVASFTGNNQIRITLEEVIGGQEYFFLIENVQDAGGNAGSFNLTRFAPDNQFNPAINILDNTVFNGRVISVDYGTALTNVFLTDRAVTATNGTNLLESLGLCGGAIVIPDDCSLAHLSQVISSQSSNAMSGFITLTEDDAGGATVDYMIDVLDDVIYIYPQFQPGQQYYFEVSGTENNAGVPLPSPSVTFTTPSTFNPVAGSGLTLEPETNSDGIISLNSSVRSTQVWTAETPRAFTNLATELGDNFTFEAWNSTSLTTSGLFETVDLSDTDVRMNFYLSGGSLIAELFNSSSTSAIIQSTTLPTEEIQNQWAHYAMSYDATDVGNEVKLYFNGTQVANGAMSINHEVAMLGTRNRNIFYGQLDEVRIWGTTLDEATISAHMNEAVSAQRAGTDNLLHYFTFDESEGNFTTDLVTNKLICVGSCALSDLVRVPSDFPLTDQVGIEVTADGEVFTSGDQLVLEVAVNNTRTAQFEIRNTGTLPLDLSSEPVFSGLDLTRFTIEYEDVPASLAAGESAGFTIGFEPTSDRTFSASMQIPTNAIDNPFTIEMLGRGVSATNGNWDVIGDFGSFPGWIASMDAHNGEVFMVYRTENGAGSTYLAKVQEGGIVVSLENIVQTSTSAELPFMEIGPDGRIWVHSLKSFSGGSHTIRRIDPTDGSVTTLVSNLFDFRSDPIGRGMALDFKSSGELFYMIGFDDGANSTTQGYRIFSENDVVNPYAEITLSQLTTLKGGNTIHEGSGAALAFDFAFDANDVLHIVAVGSPSQGRIVLGRYDDQAATWSNMGYNSSTDPTNNGQPFRDFVAIDFDSEGFLHLANVDNNNSPKYLRYLKFVVNGATAAVFESGVDSEIGDPFASSLNSGFRDVYFSIGANNEPLFAYPTFGNRSSIQAVTFEGGNFRLFNDQFIADITTSFGDNFGNRFMYNVDDATGIPFVLLGFQGSLNTLISTKRLEPGLSVLLEEKEINAALGVPTLSRGSGITHDFNLTLFNPGLQTLSFTGDPIITVSGTGMNQVTFDLSEVPAMLQAGASVEVPFTYLPTPGMTSITLTIPNSSSLTDDTYTINLEGTDDQVTGNWEQVFVLERPPFTDVDMIIDEHNRMQMVYNVFEEANTQNSWAALRVADIATDITNTLLPNGIPNTTRTSGPSGIGEIRQYPDAVADFLEDFNGPIVPDQLHMFQGLNAIQNPNSDKIYFIAPRTTPTSETDYREVSTFTPGGLEQWGFAEGEMDYEFDGGLGVRFQMINSNTTGLRISVSGSSFLEYPSANQSLISDLDLEIEGDSSFFAYTINNDLIIGSVITVSNSSNLNNSTLLTIPNAQVRENLASHTKDIEFHNGDMFLAYVTTSRTIELKQRVNGVFTDLPAPSASNVRDIQLQINAEGIPYISYLEDFNAGVHVSVIKLVEGAWEFVGNPRFSDGAVVNSSHPNSPNTPAMRAPFQIDHSGFLHVFYGEGYRFIEAPAPGEFNNLPSFTSTPVESVVESDEYSYTVTVDDNDGGDVISFSSDDLPDWLTLTDNGDRTATISGLAGEIFVGDQSFTIAATDGNIIIEQEVNLVVEDGNDIPTLILPGEATVEQGSGLQTIQITGVSDGDANLSQVLSFSVVDDNAGLVSGLSIDYVQGEETATLNLTPSEDQRGETTITVVLEDDGDPSLSIAVDMLITVSFPDNPNAIEVTNTNDAGAGSLRQAIIDANAAAGLDNIIVPEGTITIGSRLPAVTDDLVINGAGTDLTIIDGASSHQVFYLIGGALFQMNNLTVQNGFNKGGDGADRSGGAAGFGGAVFVENGNLILDFTKFTGHTAQGGNGGSQLGSVAAGGTGASSIFGVGGAGGANSTSGAGSPGLAASNFGAGGGAGGAGRGQTNNTQLGGAGGAGAFGGGGGGNGGKLFQTQGGNPGGAGGDFGGRGESGIFGGPGGGGAGLGGAIFMKSGSFLASNSTFELNSATRGNKGTSGDGAFTLSAGQNGQGQGGAIFLNKGVAYSETGVTFSSNSASEGSNDVYDFNDTPISTSPIFLSNAEVDENAGAGTNIGTLEFFDGSDLSTSSTFELVNAFGDNSAFTISGNTLSINADPDFETQSSYDLQISVDDNGNQVTGDFVIIVNDINEAPVFTTSPTLTVDENTSLVTVLEATDVDAGSSLTYSLTGGNDQTLFSVNGAELSFISIPDFEVPGDVDTDNNYDLQVSVFDGVNTVDLSITIDVLDLTEPPVGILLSTNTVEENGFADQLIGTLSALNPDAGDVHSFFIDAVGTLQNNDFKVTGDQLFTNRAFDFENEATVDVMLYIRDADNQELQQTLTIEITDSNDVPTDLVLSNTTIDENLPAGTLVGTFTGSDPDVNDVLSYDFDNLNANNVFFSIDGDQLKTAFQLSTAHSPLDITIQASDNNGGLIERNFTIEIVNLPDAPDVPDATYSVSEDAAVGFSIDQLPTTDADGETISYTVDSGNEAGAFDLSTSGALTVALPLDFEETPSYTLNVTASDGILTDAAVITINIEDVNEAPTPLADATFSIAENAGVGSLVAQLDVSDPEGEILVYSITSGNDGGEFEITTTGSINVASGLNFEIIPSYTLNIEVSDGSITSSADITINIEDVNEAPTPFADATFSIAEDAGVGSLVAQLDALDPEGEPLVYSIMSGNDVGEFEITTTGSINVASGLNFEITPSYTLNIEVSDGSLISSADITINIEDVNEAPTPLADATFSIPENAGVGSLIAQLDVSDPEGEPIVYSITSGNDGGEFEITTTGSINVVSGLNFEITPSYTLNIEVSDGLITSSANMTINIEDVNEAPTQTVLSNSIVDENVPIGTVIGSFTTTDEDVNDTHTYQLQTTFDFDINGVTRSPIAIVGNDLVTDVEFDFEVFSTFQIRVITEDAGAATLSEDFTITVNDLNEIPSSITLSANSIFENKAAGTIIGTFTTTDGDINDIHTYSLVSGFGDNADFNLSGAQLTNASVFDFETKPSYSIKVETNDGNGGTFEQEFEITVLNANDRPTAITLSKDNIDENAAVGTIIGTLSTVDQDVSDTHTYEVLTSFTFEGVTGFPIQANGSDLVTTVPMNFEIFSSFTIDVKTIDGSGFTFTETFTIQISDVNEAPTALELSNDKIPEESPLNTVIGTLSTVDEDLNDSHTYEVLTSFDVNGQQFFPIEAEGSNLVTKVVFDFESGVPEFTIDVKTTDLGGLSLTKSLTIRFTDANDAPTEITLSSNTIAENEAVGTLIGNLGAIDVDAGDTHTFSLVSGFGDNADFDVSGSSLLSASVFDFETKSSYQVKVLTDDGNGGTLEQEFTISVTDINEGDPQSITFDALADRTFDDDPFELTATASSGLTVSYSSSNTAVATISGSTVTVIGVGQTTITASQAGGSGFEAAADVTQTLTVNRASQTITFDEILDQVFGADPITLSATASSGLGVSFSVDGPATLSGSTLTLTGVGQVTVTASQSGNENYLAVSTARAFVVTDPAKTDQLITFNAPSIVYVNEGTIILEASSDSGLEVTFEIISGGDFANLSGDNLHVTAVGTIEVAASQAGNNAFNPATKVATIEIKPVFTLSGIVVDENDVTFTAGTLLAFRLEDQTGYIVNLTESGYSESFKDGTYYLAVEPTDGNMYYTTLYGDVIFWESSTPLTVNSDMSNLDIKMVAKSSDDLLTGNGTLVGRILDAGNEGGRIVQGQLMDGDPIEGVSVFLIRISDDQIMTEVVSDANGDFEITGIPEGEYRLQVEVTGVAMDLGNSTINIDAEGTPIELTALVGEDGIVLEEVITSLDEEFTNSITVYPNPFKDQFSLMLENELMGNIDIRILSVDGRALHLDSFYKNNAAFEYSVQNMNIPSGLIILQLVHDNAIATYRLIKN